MGLVDLSYGPFGHPHMGLLVTSHMGLRATIPTIPRPREDRSCGALISLGQHAHLYGPNGRLGTVRNAKLRDDAAQMLFDRAHADAEGASDVHVRVPARRQPQHLG